MEPETEARPARAVRPPRLRRGRVWTVALLALVILAAASCDVGKWTRLDLADPALPGPPASARPEDISCASAAACLAVETGSAAWWNGTSWRSVPVPWSNEKGLSALGMDVSCSSATWCVVSGTTGADGRTALVAFDGRAFRSLPYTIPSRIEKVDCVSETACFAVGARFMTLGEPSSISALVIRWNGREWTDITGPAAPTTENRVVLDIDCVSGDRCTTIGSELTTTGVPQDVSQSWDGSQWRTEIVPGGESLDRVSCATADRCFAYAQHGLVGPGRIWVHSDRGWVERVFTEAEHPGRFNVSEVSCASDQVISCVLLTNEPGAVGGVWRARRFDGTTFSPVPLPDDQQVTTAGLSCPTRSFCGLIGTDTGGPVPKLVLATGNGATWTLDRSVQPTFEASRSMLADVSCVGRDMCVAVGGAFVGGTSPHRAVTGLWNGREWSIAVAPTSVYLTAVSCATESFCVATGQGTDGSGRSRLSALKWDGQRWSDMGLPESSVHGGLTAVGCASPTYCLVIGAGTFEWDGSAWKRFGEAELIYSRIECQAVKRCLATTSVPMGFGPSAATWNGSTWVPIELPNPAPVGGPGAAVSTASCPLAGDRCVIATSTINSSGVLDARAYVGWVDGWTPIPAPDVKGVTLLQRLSCGAVDNCLVVGVNLNTDFGATLKMVAFHWDGKAWKSATPPKILSGFDAMNVAGLSCVPSWCMRVGSSSGSLMSQPDVPSRPAAEVFVR